MNKRSKVLLIILLVIVVITFLSVMSEKEDNSDKLLEDFESEITNPNNELDPLNENFDNNVLLIEIALKTENVIDKVFGVFVNLIKSVTEKII